MNIIKRSGKEVEFYARKIEDAGTKANDSVTLIYRMSKEQIKSLEEVLL